MNFQTFPTGQHCSLDWPLNIPFHQECILTGFNILSIHIRHQANREACVIQFAFKCSFTILHPVNFQDGVEMCKGGLLCHCGQRKVSVPGGDIDNICSQTHTDVVDLSGCLKYGLETITEICGSYYGLKHICTHLQHLRSLVRHITVCVFHHNCHISMPGV